MDCIAGLIPASSNNAAELRTAPGGGVLNPLAGINPMPDKINKGACNPYISIRNYKRPAIS
jgi:hypothetical protein